MERLLDYTGLSEVTGLPVRTLRTLTCRGTIPHVRLGHRIVRFVPSKVQKALQKREVKEVS
jgi:predicted DNA-binding transcriptional regulator AlpA